MARTNKAHSTLSHVNITFGIVVPGILIGAALVFLFIPAAREVGNGGVVAFVFVTLAAIVPIGFQLVRYLTVQSSGQFEKLAFSNSVAHIVTAAPIPAFNVEHNGVIIERNLAAQQLEEHGAVQTGKLPNLVAAPSKRVEIEETIAALYSGSTVGVASLGIELNTTIGRILPATLILAALSSGSGRRAVLAFLDPAKEKAVVHNEHGLVPISVQDTDDDDSIKAKFLAVMSHELRTPLNGIIAGVELLRETTHLDDRQEWLTGIIDNCGATALNQVTNILELTRLSSPEYSDGPSRPFAPLEIAKSLVEDAMPCAEQRGNIIAVSRPSTPIPYVMGHENLYRYVVQHFISNAVKFTEQGQINVELRATLDNDTGLVELTVGVRDNGIGIERKNLNQIFETFEALETSYTRVCNGSGLGLVIAQRAAKAMGGMIRVDSAVCDGSVFELVVKLPVAVKKPKSKTTIETEIQSKQQAEEKVSQPMRILIAEDNRVNREVLREILEVEGHTVHEAPDGREAAKLAATERYDAVLMDISMRNLDGMSATELIRTAGPNQQVPIIGVTAHALPDEIDTFLASGMDDVIVKPIRKNIIRAVLYRANLQANSIVRSTMIIKDEDEGDAQMSEHLIDVDVIDSLLEILDRESLGGYVDQFVEECQDAVATMEHKMSEADWQGAAQAAHKAAGVAATVGASSAQRLLNEFERAAKEGHYDECYVIPEQVKGIAQLAADQLKARL